MTRTAEAVAADIEERAREWVRSCTENPYRGRTPRGTFEAVLQDMAHTTYRLPAPVVARVRELLPET